MNVKIENVEKNVVQLEIEVDAAKFEEGMQRSFFKNAKKFNIPGFRRGKAPRSIIERYYGEQVFYEDAINYVCPEAYDEAIKENNIHPVDRPEIDIKQIGSGENLIFTAKVTVKPEVELGEYKGVEVNKVEAVVTDEDVENELKRIVERNARMVTVEDRPVQSGDIAVIDFEGFIDGVPFEGGKGENYNLLIGSGHFIPGFEDQLIGANTGDDVDVNVTFPEDYGNKDLAGKPTLFKVKVKEIKFKELPVVDDEFAKDVSEFETLEEYKADLRKKLTEAAEHKAKHETEEKVIEKVVENAVVDIPRVMIERQIDNIVYDLDLRLRYQGMNLKTYLEYQGMDEKSFREQFSERAEREVKTQLVIEKIKEVENIDASEEELKEEIKRLAENYKEDPEAFEKRLKDEDKDYIKDNLIVRKTIDFLVDNAKLV
ncbi:MAG TPA: trigger factor [Clostridiaceae bacterium]|nr:trigger factor [Clostridiaceae bacterium]